MKYAKNGKIEEMFEKLDAMYNDISNDNDFSDREKGILHLELSAAMFKMIEMKIK